LSTRPIRSMASEDKKKYLYVPDLKLALPHELATKVFKVGAPIELVLTYPVRVRDSVLDPEAVHTELLSKEVQVHWKVKTVFESRGSEDSTPDTMPPAA